MVYHRVPGRQHAVDLSHILVHFILALTCKEIEHYHPHLKLRLTGSFNKLPKAILPRLELEFQTQICLKIPISFFEYNSAFLNLNLFIYR